MKDISIQNRQMDRREKTNKLWMNEGRSFISESSLDHQVALQ